MSGARVRFELDEDHLRQMFVGGGTVWLFMVNFTNRVLNRARLYTPVRTGYLRNSLTSAVVPSGQHIVTGLVGTPVEYAAAVHDGTRPHTIRAKSGGVLAFSVGGRKVYATSVQHPGTQGRPFLRRALEEEMAGYS